MNKQQYLTLAELANFMEGHGNMYTNPNGVDIDLAGSFGAQIKIWDKMPVEFSIGLDMEEEDPELTKKLNLKTTADLQNMDEKLLWEQYRNGNALVYADFYEFLDAELSFQLKNGKTVISSDVLGYQDEVDAQWDHIDQFRTYVRYHIQELYIAAEEKAERDGGRLN